jgi:hypothetical protein
MIRNTIVFLLLLFGVFFTGLYLAYDEIDPCHALAVEKARHAPVPTAVAEVWSTIATARMNRLACTKSLIVSWRDRIAD